MEDEGDPFEDMFDNEDIPTYHGKKGEDEKMVVRMTHRKNRKNYILYPEDTAKGYWDMYITLILMITCITTPMDIAFSDNSSNIKFEPFGTFIDLMFLMDMIIIFNTAFYSGDMDIVDSRRVISHNYLTGWFTVDIMAILPFDIILNATQFNSMVRFARFGRLYKLVKLTRLLRVLKIFKEQNKLIKKLTEFLKIGLGFERLFFFIMIFMLALHILSCFNLIVASMYATDENIYPVEFGVSMDKVFK
jgi:hypothetical protein